MSAFSKAIRKQIALGRSLEFRPLHRRTDGLLVGVHLRLHGCPDDPNAPQEDRYISNDLLDDIRVMHDRTLAECVEHMGTMLTAALALSRGTHPNGLRR